MIDAPSYWALVERRARETPDALLALDEQGRTLSFGGLEQEALRVAAGLAALGVARDEVMSWMLPTRLSALVQRACHLLPPSQGLRLSSRLCALHNCQLFE